MGKEDQGAPDGRYQLIARTLCFITHQDEILLLKGAPDKRLWANLYNGVGGHVEPGEDFATAARREIGEETQLAVPEIRLCGLITIEVEPAHGIVIGVFRGEADAKMASPSAEGELVWFSQNSLPPAEEMVEDLPILLDRVLNARPATPPFCAHYHYDQQNQLVISFAE